MVLASLNMSAGAGQAASAGRARARGILAFLDAANGLKHTVRAGWVRTGVQNPESVAEHSWRMALLGFLAAQDESLDYGRCVRIAIVHDLAEAIVGDITPFCGVDEAEKHRREREALEKMMSMLGAHPAADEIRDAYLEYERASTPEGRLVKDFDKLEMLVQAAEYERAQPGLDLSTFFDVARGKIKSPFVKMLAEEVEERRVHDKMLAVAGGGAGAGTAAAASTAAGKSASADAAAAPAPAAAAAKPNEPAAATAGAASAHGSFLAGAACGGAVVACVAAAAALWMARRR